MTTTIPTSLRNANLNDLAEMLQGQQARKHDIVVSPGALRAERGHLVVAGSEPVIDLDGVTNVDGHYLPTEVCDEGLAEKLDIHRSYLARCRAQHIDLYDQNVNGWIGHPSNAAKKWLVRTFRSDNGGPGIARAFLSNGFRIIDNLDVLMATLEGIQDSGAAVTIDGCDLTDRSMRVRVSCPAVQALAPKLLEGYRSPFTGRSGADDPVVFAGFLLSNSEVGSGAFTIVPRITIRVCSNGQTFTKEALRAAHLGSRMDDGVIQWSTDTLEKNLALVRAQTRDAVATFLDVAYVEKKIAELEGDAAAPVDPTTIVATVAKALRYTDDQQKTILDMFIRGGQLTAGGVMQAVTAAAQVESDADRAAELEASALQALTVAARG